MDRNLDRDIDALDNLSLEDRAHLVEGDAIAILFTQSRDLPTIWGRVGTVRKVSDDGTIVIYTDERTTGRGSYQWTEKDEWIARWPQG